MSDVKKIKRLSKIAREFNVGISTIVDYLNNMGYEIEANPNTKVSDEIYEILVQEYSSEIKVKKESESLSIGIHSGRKETVSLDDVDEGKPPEDQAETDEEILIQDVSGAAKEEELAEPVEEADEEKDTVIEDKGKKEEPEEEKEQEKEQEKEEIDKKPAKKKTEKKAEEKKKDVEEKDETEKEAAREDKKDIKIVGKIDIETIRDKAKPGKKDKKKKEDSEKEEDEKDKKKKKPKEEEKAKDKEPIDEEQEDTGVETASSEEVAETQKLEEQVFKFEVEKLSGPTVVGKIDLPAKDKKVKYDDDYPDIERPKKKKRRKRIAKDKELVDFEKVKGDRKKATEKTKEKSSKSTKSTKKKRIIKPEISEEEVQKQIKDTLAQLTSKTKSKAAKYRKEKRDAASQKHIEEVEKQEQEKNILKVTEFVSVNELASMMNVPINEVIETCMNLGLFVSINQRLDAETMSLVADEFEYKVEIISVDVLDSINDLNASEDENAELVGRPPIVTVMGHVDHGKTSLLDYIRKTNVIAGESGGITQHIGAYNVSINDKKNITFLDTPGHEAFTAMRARGAQVTDIAIIVVAADDNVMPQTIEAINHAQAAGVPIVFAINKIDKDGANPEIIKEALANMNFIVEDWGGKYQSQDISAKKGENIEELLEKVLLEAELLDLKANPDRKAYGTVIESSLDKGRGFIATILVESGTLRVGDIMLAGSYTGHIKAMYNERNQKVEEAGPATPVLILGLNGAPQAGDKFNVMESDREAREIANKREQLIREQGLRAQKQITLDEIGRRIAIGNFQELNVIVKGDVDGSIEALSDALIKLSTDEIQVKVIHKAVGQISESDVMLATASQGVIIGFQVRPSSGARRLAEKESIDIRLYSIIYDAINEVRAAMEGMLSPEIKEEISGSVEVKEIFKISKVGTVAGCIVTDGKILRNNKVRVIREGIVVYTGELASLKRFNDDVKEVNNGLECGLNVANFNDIKVGDIIEAYQEIEVQKHL